MASYSAKHITVLEGLDPVRKRPGMYIGGVGSAGLHHLVWEIVDNAVDEAMNGHASELQRHTAQRRAVGDGELTMAAVSPSTSTPNTRSRPLEIIFSTLHAGGKFGQEMYKTAGGLARRGSFRSQRTFRASGRKGEARWAGVAHGVSLRQGFREAEKSRARRAAAAPAVTFRPDPEIFPEDRTFPSDVIRERLEVASYLHKGLKVAFIDETSGRRDVFQHPEGIVDFLQAGHPRTQSQAEPRCCVQLVSRKWD